MWDVVVVGAGCVGSYLARLLAEGGLQVLVLERDRAVGDSVNCSGIVGTGAFSSIDLPADTIQTELCAMTISGPSGRSVTYRPPEPLAYVVDRVAFDRRLAEQARQRGVDYALESSVDDVEVGRDGVLVRARTPAGRRTFRAEVCVLATGLGSPLPQRAGLGRIAGWIQGVQLQAQMAEVEHTEVYLGRNVAPGSFAWVVPVGDGWCKVGLLAPQRGGALLRRFLRSPQVADRLRAWDGTLRASLLPMSLLPRSSSERLLVAGEAAGQTKFTTSGGIYYGLLCAQSAAEVLARAFARGDFSAEALAPYDASWRARLAREQKTGMALRRIFARMCDRDIDAFIALARVDGIMPLAHKLFRFDWHAPFVSALLQKHLRRWTFRGP